eukprot:m.74452 g.74452  ORF g.74452 m.74452 type:complete len:164 (+) comp18896_c0_seq2:359-850(+)
MAGNTTGISLSGFVGGVIGGAAVATAVHLLGRRGGVSPSRSRQIIRIGTTDPRSSSVVIRDGLVTLSGQVAEIDKLAESDITLQTEQTLRKVDALLAKAGTNKSEIIEARIWVKDINRDFKAMNAVWNKWVDPTSKGCRFCVEANMARENILVEIQVIAATST